MIEACQPGTGKTRGLALTTRICRRQVFLDCRGALASPVRRACRTGTVPLAVELIEGHGAGGEREPGRDARMPAGSRTGLRDGRAAARVPADRAIQGREADGSPESSSRPPSPPASPDHPVADLTQKQIKRRPVVGGLINEYERAA
jgi:hypothetical protein